MLDLIFFVFRLDVLRDFISYFICFL